MMNVTEIRIQYSLNFFFPLAINKFFSCIETLFFSVVFWIDSYLKFFHADFQDTLKLPWKFTL